MNLFYFIFLKVKLKELLGLHLQQIDLYFTEKKEKYRF